MRSGSVRIATIAGIPIRIHVSFLLVLPLVAFGFQSQMGEAAELARVDPSALGTPWIWGVGIALALFACVLLHELAHSLYAVWRGGKVEDITLLLIGGVSRITRPPKGHGHEALMALAGPATSLAIGAGFLAIHALSAELGDSVRFGSFYLGYLNVFLGLFNLLPAFPMDGGRVLRGVLAIPLGHRRATAIAAYLGRAFAAVFVLTGLSTGNLILVLIGFVVWTGAGAERTQANLLAEFEGVAARDVMTRAPAPIDAGASIAEAATRMLSEREPALVVTERGTIAGILSVEDLRPIAPEVRALTRIREAVRLKAPPLLSPDSGVAGALSSFGEGFAALPVVEDGHLVGLVTPIALLRARDLRSIAHARPRWRWREV